jgi:CreA protein
MQSGSLLIETELKVKKLLTAILFGTLLSPMVIARDVGNVDTAFKLLGANHKVIVQAFEDPKIAGVTCFLSRAKTGGITGSMGLAEDPSDASVACRQSGKIAIKAKFSPKEEVFNENANILFKKVRVVRFYDSQTNTVLYLVYSDKLIDGSPKNSISAVWLDSVRP